MGINEIEEIVVAGGRLANLVEQLMDGFQLRDIDDALATARTIPSAIKGAATAWDEYVDMDDAEAEKLENRVQAEFELDNDEAEAFIEKAFDFLISLHDFAKLIPKKKVM